MKDLLTRIKRILRDRRIRKHLTRLVSLVAAVVVFMTTYALVLPAITMEGEAKCGMEAHQHDDSCYEEILICNIPESDGHHHDDSCYKVSQELVCNQEEHQHSDACYDEEGNLICELSEHTHGKDCYEEKRELVCEIPESEGHHHDASCYKKVLICGKEAHTHSESCYQDNVENAEQDAASGNAADPAESENTGADSSTAGDTDSELTDADNAGTAETILPEQEQEAMVPELAPLDFRTILNKKTGVYYYHVKPEEKVEDSSQITDWTRAKDNNSNGDDSTELTSDDLIRVYLSYTIPGGSLNTTNPTARYRLPGSIRLSDNQIKAINKAENGISRQYDDKDKHDEALGAEAIEGTRRPDQDIDDYLEKNGQEYISATVKAENVFNDETGEYEGQDLIFTFAPYTVEKNQNVYDAAGEKTKSGEKVHGWFTFDLTTDQVEWGEPTITRTETSEADEKTEGENTEAENADADNTEAENADAVNTEPENAEAENDEADNTAEETVTADSKATSTIIERSERTAEIEFVVEENDKVETTLKLVEEKETENTEKDETDPADEEAVPEFSAGTLETSGDGYKITLDYTAEAQIPENASLSVREITAETDPEAYEACLEQAGKRIASEGSDKAGEKRSTVDENASRFFDIEIVVNETDENGQETSRKIEPKAEVSVNIQITDTTAKTSRDSAENAGENDNTSKSETQGTQEPTVLHFTDDGVEKLESTVMDEKNAASENNGSEDANAAGEDNASTEIQFTTDSFSIYGVVYTVDFHWEVDGKEYSFSLPGGGFVSFTNLSEALGIAREASGENENDSDSEANDLQTENRASLNDIEISELTKEFVSDVEKLTFSNPDLVWVGKVENDSTVGGLKEANKLECEYSAELTEEQIAEINAQTVKAGDWALISVQPFESEETLTVTMKTGEVFVIKVTDAMDMTPPYSKGHTFTAYDTRPDGFTINLFDYGPESDLDNGNNNLLDNGSQLNSGINHNHALKFTAYGKKPSEVQTNGRNVLTRNHFSGTEAATQGIVDRNLSGGYPKLNEGESLAYLFNTTPDGDNKKVYKDVSGLFQKDADGKYYYNSNENYAYYDPNQGNGGNFQLCDTFPEEGSDWGVGFFPFNEWNGSKNCIHWNGWCPRTNSGNSGRYYYNHHFGMTLEGSFQLTPDGKLNDKDLVFNFSGDDDLWVYIDDVLVLDIGGIHNPVGGSINFRTGDVKVNSAYQVNSVINDSQSGPEVHTTIARAFEAAGKTWNNEPYAEHTIKVFYVERGGCYSNCQMEFNLTRFKDVEFNKEDQYGDPIENAEFRLFKEDGSPLIETYVDHDDNDTVKYREYVRYSDEDGHIKFDHVPVGTYYIRETSVPEGYIKDEATYTAKIVVERNDDGTYSVHSYVLRNGTQTEQVLNTKQADITLSLDKKWKIGDTEVTPSAATASFQLMRVKIVEETHTEPGTKTPAVVKLQDKNGTSLCSDLSIEAGDTIKISGYKLNIPWGASEATDDVKLGSKTVGTLRTWNSGWNQNSQDITYTVTEEDITNGEVILKLNSKTTGDFSSRPALSIESKGPEPDPVTVTTETTVTEAVETFDLPDENSWSKSFTKPLYDEHGKMYTYYFVETSNSEGTAPVYVDGNGQVIGDPSALAADEDTTQTIINKVENGSIEITKNLLKNGTASSLTGTFYYAVYAEADVENGAPKEGTQPLRTGSITVGDDDNGTHSETIQVPLGTYYVYELTGKGGTPIVESSRQRIGERTYRVTGSGTSTAVGVTDGSAVFTNNYETVEKTATKSWSDNTDHPTIYFKLFYVSRGVDAEQGPVIEFVAVDSAEIKELSNGTTSVTWNDLPKYDANGEEYTYIVKEYIKKNDEYIAAAPDGYVKSENGLTVNNTKSEGYNPKTSYVGTKTWEDAANNGATRPDSLHVDLYANGVKQEDCIAQWTKGTGDAANIWTYTFSDLPVFDSNGVYIQYYAVETPVPGYDQGPTAKEDTSYQVIGGTVDGNIERVTTCSNLDITLAEETDLAYVVIKKSAKKHLVWTQRAITQAEKNKIYQDINQVSGFIGELNDSTVDFISGLPVETEFFKGTVTASKSSDKVMHIEFANHETWAQLCYGSYRYDYDPGRTDFINSLITTEADATKAWQDADGQPMTPPEGTTVTFDLYANGDKQSKPVTLNGKTDVSELSEDTDVAKTQEVNTAAITANAYEKEAWKAYWGNLPTHNSVGEEITYTVRETKVPGFENMNPAGVASGGTITNKQIVTDINILKVGENDRPLIGAKFRLDQYDDTRKDIIKTWGPVSVSAETGKEGTLSFEGLGIGKYTIVETDTPEGYVKTIDDPEFEVVETDGVLTVSFTNVPGVVTYEPTSKTFTVHNEPGAALPNAGGPGTVLHYTLGTICMLLAGALLTMRRLRR